MKISEICKRTVKLVTRFLEVEPTYNVMNPALSTDLLCIFHGIAYSGVGTAGDNNQPVTAPEREGCIISNPVRHDGSVRQHNVPGPRIGNLEGKLSFDLSKEEEVGRQVYRTR